MSVKPAMTPEEWAVARDYWGVPSVILGQVGSTLANGAFVSESNRHALAALCLHEQEFGFTREDVNALQEAINGGYDGMDMIFWVGEEIVQRLQSLTSRISDLLPPEDVA